MDPSPIAAFARMGHFRDSKYLKPWADEIGALLVNFGGLEILTYRYFVLLQSSAEAMQRFLKLQLSPRIDHVIRLLDQATTLPETERQLAIRDWNEVLKMTEWRNHIAHNPVLPYWRPDQDLSVEPPEGVMMPDIRDLPFGRPGVCVSLELLQELVAVSANLSRRLNTSADAFIRI